MNLVEFCPFYPPHVGGLESHAAEFNAQMSKLKGVESVTVFTPRLPENGTISETIGPITILRFPAFELFPNYPVPKFWTLQFWRLYRKIKNEPPTTVVSRTRFFFTSMMAWRFAKRYQLPWVHIEHGSDFIQVENQIASWVAWLYDLTIGRFLLQRADRVVAISDAVADFVARIANVTAPVIYRGADKVLIQSTPPNQSLLKRYALNRRIGYIGRLIEGKGVLDLCAAVAKLDELTVCFIVGDGPHRGAIEAYISKNGLGPKIKLLGAVPQKQAIAVLKAMTVVVNPSYTEGLPSSVIEAVLSRVPCVATDVGGTREIIEGGVSGYLIPARAIDTMVESIRTCLSDAKKSRAMAELAYHSAASRFSWTVSRQKYYALFEALDKQS